VIISPQKAHRCTKRCAANTSCLAGEFWKGLLGTIGPIWKHHKLTPKKHWWYTSGRCVFQTPMDPHILGVGASPTDAPVMPWSPSCVSCSSNKERVCSELGHKRVWGGLGEGSIFTQNTRDNSRIHPYIPSCRTRPKAECVFLIANSTSSYAT
jgi:hypothetical protein